MSTKPLKNSERYITTLHVATDLDLVPPAPFGALGNYRSPMYSVCCNGIGVVPVQLSKAKVISDS